MDFTKYILQFSKDTEKVQTHLSFNKGKYNVPDKKYEEFYQKYYQCMIKNETLFLIEKVYNSDFAFFMDLDAPRNKSITLDDSKVGSIIQSVSEVIDDMFEGDITVLTKHKVSKRMDKYHINFPEVIVDSITAKRICSEIEKRLDATDCRDVTACIDTSVYKTGLRLLGSRKADAKKKDEQAVYKLYDITTGKYTELEKTSYEDFMSTVVRRKENIVKSKLKAKYEQSLTTASEAKKRHVPVKGIENSAIVDEVGRLLQDLKVTNECLKDYDMTIERIYARQNKMGMFCYFVSVNQKVCPFKQREHQRASNPIYIEIGMNGVFVKCHDEDCLRRRFPEEGVKLPEDYAIKYPQMYLSMSTKYWKSDVTLTEDIKHQLEDSLAGSHYQIAKAAFCIYKDRFRVDDVRNTTWYEFDGVRWNKSHLMNILVSEDVPKYYKGIKISDTSVANDNLKDFLVNNEKIDANLRNQMVDNIISKLENVTFKTSVLSQLAYFYKTYDSDFCNHLDSNPYLIGFKNGVYDFKQNTYRQSTLGDYLTFSTGYDYIEYDENCQQVKEIYEFLSKIITNKRVREYTLKVLGKALVGLPDERFYIWTGISGANGKSTLVNFLESTLGDYTTSVDVSLLTNRRGNSSNASPDIVRLKGKRLFTFQEPEHDDKLRTGILKQFTGGDTIIARELFKAPVTFKLQGTMVMCCNDLPSVASIDGGTFRRIRVVEFNSRFCDNPTKPNEFKIDPTIKSKIREWRPYFMSILIHWYNKYLYEGLNEPEEVMKATAKYKNDNDKFNEFFDHCLEEAEEFETNKNIYSQFQGWWSSNYPSTKIPEIRELRRAMKIKFGNEKERVINGAMYYGFNVRVKYDTNIISKDDDL